MLLVVFMSISSPAWTAVTNPITSADHSAQRIFTWPATKEAMAPVLGGGDTHRGHRELPPHRLLLLHRALKPPPGYCTA